MDKLEKALQKARATRGSAETPLRRLDLSTPPKGAVTLDESVLDANKIFAHRARDQRADLVRLLRTQVLQAMGKTGAKTLAVTSPNYGDGKTTLAINLALSIALDLNQTALLVDLDIRKPSVASYLGLSPEKGLTDHLAEGTPLPDCLIRLSFDRLSILPSGSVFDNSSEILASPQMTALAAELRARYPDRVIIYDMPPLLEQDDPLAFLPNVDAVLMVVRESVSTTQALRRCASILEGKPVIGTVLNDSD